MSPTPIPSPGPPFWPTEATTWAPLVTMLVVVVGAVFAFFQLRLAVRTQRGSAMSELSRRWDDELIVSSRHMAGQYSPARLQRRVEFLEDQQHPDYDVLMREPNFLEDLAILEEEGAISFDMIKKSLGGTVTGEWDHWKPTVIWMRGDQKYNLVYEHFETLAERLREEEPALPKEAPG